MTQKKQIYKCEICGNIVEVLHEGADALVCCGQPMKLLRENTVDAALEKHVPVIEKTETGFKVKVGSVEHPMIEEHYIEWIDFGDCVGKHCYRVCKKQTTPCQDCPVIKTFADGKSYRQFLSPGQKPEAEFCIKAEKVEAREYCNLHGLWKN